MRNMRANLSYRAYRGTDAVRPAVAAISDLEAKSNEAGSNEALMGYEGSARAWYFEAWPHIDARLAFGPRRRRPPNNPINCLISWFNGLVYSAAKARDCADPSRRLHLVPPLAGRRATALWLSIFRSRSSLSWLMR